MSDWLVVEVVVRWLALVIAVGCASGCVVLAFKATARYRAAGELRAEAQQYRDQQRDLAEKLLRDCQALYERYPDLVAPGAPPPRTLQ
jgi:hypothetical protein